MRLIFTIFQLPFWVFFAIAGGVFYLGELSHGHTLAKNQEMERALAGQPPETVDLAEFSRADHMGLADEVSVRAVVNTDYNYELTKKRKGVDTTRFMFVLFDASDTEEAKVARGALVLTEAEKDKFATEYYEEHSEITFGSAGIVSAITINGRDEGSPDLSSLVRDAFEEQNLTKAEDFIYIEPFLEGRTVGLTPTMSADQMRNYIRAAGMFVALIGVVQFVMRRRKKANAQTDEEPELETAGTAHPVAVSAMTPAYEPEPNTDPDVAAETPKKRVSMPLKLLVLVGLAGFLIYSGSYIYAAIIALIALQFFAVKKTSAIIKGGISRLGVRLPGVQKSDDAIMADIQSKVDLQPETTQPEPVQTVADEVPEVKVAKSGFPFSLAKLRRKAATEENAADNIVEAAIEAEALPVAQPEDKKAKRAFKLSLPAFGRKPADAGIAKKRTALAPVHREKSVFQSAPLYATDETEEKIGFFDKIQLMLARLAPAEREPKIFADRPDPFDRLAADARRSSAS